MNEQRGKICAVCGEDCSGKPRTKDVHNNYYCKSCYEQRLEAVRQGKRNAPPKPMVEAPPAPSADELFAIDPSLIEASAAATPPVGSACPSCGMGVQPGAALCMNCGFNLATGQALHTKIKKAPRMPTGEAASMLMSPPVVGLGTLGLFALLFFLGTQSTGGAIAFLFAYAALGLGVGIWAIVTGFMEGVGYGLATLCVPFFVLYTVFGLNDNQYLKWLYGVNLLCIPAYMVLAPQLDSFLNAH